MISNLEVNLSKNPNEKEEISNEMDLLRAKKEEIMKNPDILGEDSFRVHHRLPPFFFFFRLSFFLFQKLIFFFE